MSTWVTAVVAVVLAVGTVIGVVEALGDSTKDRVAPSSTAPVYGSN